MDLGLNGQRIAVQGSGRLAERCAGLLAAEGAELVDAEGPELPACSAVVAIAPRINAPNLDAVDDANAFAAWGHVTMLVERFRAASGGMAERGYGRIIWVGPLEARQRGREAGDLAGLVGLGALGLIKAMSGELGPHGITCNSVLWDGQDVESAAAATVFLASRPSGYVTGVAISIDGGKSESVF